MGRGDHYALREHSLCLGESLSCGNGCTDSSHLTGQGDEGLATQASAQTHINEIHIRSLYRCICYDHGGTEAECLHNTYRCDLSDIVTGIDRLGDLFMDGGDHNAVYQSLTGNRTAWTRSFHEVS